ncbi:reticulon-3 isoform X3 [Gouania willdenowi]|uniref:reticulon-3 isoform X3 n=1 Tax=Gouania willdenowi TaxID=441366 RepID=UPI001054A743|nr:reticulon-3 isoform X3 [Gouania willdenowi]
MAPVESSQFPQKTTSTLQNKDSFSDQSSPETPFEMLGDLQQVSEYEETVEWMKAHLPPAPNVCSVDLNKGSNIATAIKNEVDTVFKNSPLAAANNNDLQKQLILDEDFDISFLPTAHIQPEIPEGNAQSDDSISSSPVHNEDLGSPALQFSSPNDTDEKQCVLEEKMAWERDLEPPEASEADSSGESDDTVIEDGVGIQASDHPASPDFPLSHSIDSTAPNLATVDNEPSPPKSGKKLMQVPTINVIETDEPNYSDEDMEPGTEEDEECEVVEDSQREAPQTTALKSEPPNTRPLETEFIEGYSPPSSPVDSDTEFSPKHKILESTPINVNQINASKSETPSSADSSKNIGSDAQQTQSGIQHTPVSKVNVSNEPFPLTNEKVNFLNNDEWSGEVQNISDKSERNDPENSDSCTQYKVDEKRNSSVTTSKTTLLKDDIYDKESFDYEYDVSSYLDDFNGNLNAKERFLSTQNDGPEVLTSQNTEDFHTQDSFPQPSLQDCPPNPYPSFICETITSGIMGNNSEKITTDVRPDTQVDNVLPPLSLSSKVQKDTKATHHSTDTESIISEPSDSFLDFMRECLKSEQDKAPKRTDQDAPQMNKLSRVCPSLAHSAPTVVPNLEQEQLTINAIKQLSFTKDDQEDEEAVNLQLNVSDEAQSNPISSKQSSLDSVPLSTYSQSNPVSGTTYPKGAETIGNTFDDSYRLAEHVLTAILTHLSVNALIHWRDPKKSGLVFGLSMLVLLSLAAFSVISVVSYLLLALLCVTITFRIYKSVVQAVQKSNEGHPFKALIDKDVSIPPETFRKHVDASLTYINRALKQMSRLFLVEDLVDSLKLAVVMWLLTYVGAVFNGITILILADILLFAVPPIYEKNKTQIDHYIDLARTQINSTIAKLQEKLPGAVKRSKTE